jgi:uncharacterized protein (DUF1778 family)
MTVAQRKPRAARKDSEVRIRVTAAQKKILVAAAQQTGLDVSAWLRSVGLREAAQLASSPASGVSQ